MDSLTDRDTQNAVQKNSDRRVAEIRAEALEEAAQLLESGDCCSCAMSCQCGVTAEAIRALGKKES